MKDLDKLVKAIVEHPDFEAKVKKIIDDEETKRLLELVDGSGFK